MRPGDQTPHRQAGREGRRARECPRTARHPFGFQQRPLGSFWRGKALTGGNLDGSGPGHQHQRKIIRAPRRCRGSGRCGGCFLLPVSPLPPCSSSSLSSAKSVTELTLQRGRRDRLRTPARPALASSAGCRATVAGAGDEPQAEEREEEARRESDAQLPGGDGSVLRRGPASHPAPRRPRVPIPQPPLHGDWLCWVRPPREAAVTTSPTFPSIYQSSSSSSFRVSKTIKHIEHRKRHPEHCIKRQEKK